MPPEAFGTVWQGFRKTWHTSHIERRWSIASPMPGNARCSRRLHPPRRSKDSRWILSVGRDSGQQACHEIPADSESIVPMIDGPEKTSGQAAQHLPLLFSEYLTPPRISGLWWLKLLIMKSRSSVTGLARQQRSSTYCCRAVESARKEASTARQGLCRPLQGLCFVSMADLGLTPQAVICAAPAALGLCLAAGTTAPWARHAKCETPEESGT